MTDVFWGSFEDVSAGRCLLSGGQDGRDGVAEDERSASAITQVLKDQLCSYLQMILQIDSIPERLGS